MGFMIVTKERKEPSAASRNQNKEMRQTKRPWQKDGGKNIRLDASAL
jgi:hypothetical protein